MLRVKLGHDDDVGPGRQGLEDVHGEAKDMEHRDDGKEAVLGLSCREISHKNVLMTSLTRIRVELK